MPNRRTVLKLTAAAAASQIVPSPVAADTPAPDPVKAITDQFRHLSADQLEQIHEAAELHLVLRGEFVNRFPLRAAQMGMIGWEEAEARILERQAARIAARERRAP